MERTSHVDAQFCVLSQPSDDGLSFLSSYAGTMSTFIFKEKVGLSVITHRMIGQHKMSNGSPIGFWFLPLPTIIHIFKSS